MEDINCTHFNFLDDFDNSYKYVDNVSLTKYSSLDIDEMQHLNFYGPNGSFKNYYVYYLIKHLTKCSKYNNNTKSLQQKITVNNNIVEFDVVLNSNYVEVNPSMNNFYDRWIITDYIQNMIKSKNIIQKKHIILLKEVDKLSTNAYMALRRMLEKYSPNALFIFTSTNYSHINEAIISRCINIRCGLQPETNFNTFLGHYIQDKQLLKKILGSCHRNIDKATILLYKNFSNEFVPVLENEVKAHFALMKKTKDVMMIAKYNRDFLHKILNFNYEKNEIMKIFIDTIIKNYCKKDENKMSDSDRNKIYKFIALTAETDVTIVKSNKDFFVYENYLLKLYKLLHFDEDDIVEKTKKVKISSVKKEKKAKA